MLIWFLTRCLTVLALAQAEVALALSQPEVALALAQAKVALALAQAKVAVALAPASRHALGQLTSLTARPRATDQPHGTPSGI